MAITRQPSQIAKLAVFWYNIKVGLLGVCLFFMPEERFKLISAAHLFLIRDGQVLLLRRFNTGYEDGNYSVPAGHIEQGEKVTATMLREAYEEAGVIIKQDDLKVVHVMHRKSTEERFDFFLCAEKWTGEILVKEPNKCDQLQWFSLKNLPPNIIPYISEALNNFENGVFYSEFDW